MEQPMTAADVGAVIGNRDGGWSGGEWIFGLIVLAALFNGGFGGYGNNRGDAVTEAGLCNSMNFNNLENAVGRLSDNQAAIARQTDNAICNLGYTNLEQFNALGRQMADCCCSTQQLIQEEGNKTRDLIQTNKIEALQNKVAQLEMDARMCGVPRMPTSFTYAVNPSNIFGGNCSCGNTIF